MINPNLTREVYKNTTYYWMATLGCLGYAITPQENTYMIWYFQHKCVYAIHDRVSGDRKEFLGEFEMKSYLAKH